MRLRSGSAACHDVRMIKRYFDCVAWCYRFRVSICQRLTATARGVLPFVYSGRHHRSFTGWTKLGQFDRILKKSKLRLASSRCFPYISFLRKGTAERSDAVIGMSSNGRTADSGSVNGGSTPSIPATLARSSSGLGHRPLKAKIESSNLLRATKCSQAGIAGLFSVCAFSRISIIFCMIVGLMLRQNLERGSICRKQGKCSL